MAGYKFLTPRREGFQGGFDLLFFCFWSCGVWQGWDVFWGIVGVFGIWLHIDTESLDSTGYVLFLIHALLKAGLRCPCRSSWRFLGFLPPLSRSAAAHGHLLLCRTFRRGQGRAAGPSKRIDLGVQGADRVVWWFLGRV